MDERDHKAMNEELNQPSCLGAVRCSASHKFKNMNWTEPKPPTEGISYYDHTICETPFGKLKIEWKSWKESDSYDVMLNDSDWVGAEYDLESAKELARNYLVKKHKELSELLGL